jgi:hypothetical protein
MFKWNFAKDNGLTYLDELFITAYEFLQNETCPECGEPVWVCHNDSNDIQFKGRETICYKTRARIQYKEERTKVPKKSRDKQAGITYLVRTVFESGKLPRRKRYYKEQEDG